MSKYSGARQRGQSMASLWWVLIALAVLFFCLAGASEVANGILEGVAAALLFGLLMSIKGSIAELTGVMANIGEDLSTIVEIMSKTQVPSTNASSSAPAVQISPAQQERYSARAAAADLDALITRIERDKESSGR